MEDVSGDGVAKKVELVPKCVEDVLKRYQDVMPEDLPNELPPRREVDHKIEVKPGTEPPSKVPYRLSQKELEELKSQLDELLAERLHKAKQVALRCARFVCGQERREVEALR